MQSIRKQSRGRAEPPCPRRRTSCGKAFIGGPMKYSLVAYAPRNHPEQTRDCAPHLICVSRWGFSPTLEFTLETEYRSVLPQLGKMKQKPSDAEHYAVALRDRLRSLDSN